MSVLTLEAKLERHDPGTPWGFRMQGGKDFNCPLTIQRVLQGSLAAKCGLQQGDIILKIGEGDAVSMIHKDAQSRIASSGNKLDLLLQRGTTPHQYTYEKFETPHRPSTQPIYGQPNSSPMGVNYNQSARPFGSSSVDAVTKKTQNLSFTPKPVSTPVAPVAPADYTRYTEREEKPSADAHQSKSFRHLQDVMAGGHDPPSALKPLPSKQSVPVNRQSPSPPPVVGVKSTRPGQYNTPVGLYSNESVNSAYRLQRSSDEDEPSYSKTSSDSDDTGKKVYYPSETFKLVQEQENQVESPKADNNYKVNPSRTFKMLQDKLGAGESQQTPSKAPGAPKPAKWSPPSSTGSAAPVAKPFSPSGAPPAPAAPGGPRMAPKPTGVGAVRGSKGDVSMFKAGDAAPGGTRIPMCSSCGNPIRGPFVVAMHKTWCPDHFVCSNPRCGRQLLDIGFVEEGGFLYCEKDYEQYFAPHCAVCSGAIVGECVNALQKTYHPECFKCYKCNQMIGGNQFHLEDGHPYCEADWKAMFQTMCKSCEFPIEPGDRWVEAMGCNYHSECFNCSTCQINLEGQPFYAKAGKPFCKKHAK